VQKNSEIVVGFASATALWCIVAVFGHAPDGYGPILKDFAAPVATLVAAAAAGWIAYRLGQAQIAVAKSQADIAERNWQTANEKVVLELFERRLNIYEGLRDCVGEVARSGDATDDVLYRYGTASDRAPYFFGAEVQSYIEKIRRHMIELQFGNKMMKNDLRPDRGECVDKVHDEFLAVTAFYQDAPRLFEPYIKAHQKVA
jgi:hypothetical protein